MRSLSHFIVVNFQTAASVAAVFVLLACSSVSAQEPSIVQPGAPGQPTKVLPASTRAKLPPTSRKDVDFMQGMIMHHQQAVDMTALIEERTTNKNIRLIGARISQSQKDEMDFMKRWLQLRGESTEHDMHGKTPAKSPAQNAAAHGHDAPAAHAAGAHASGDEMLMPGMLTAQQMDALRRSKGVEFDRLFLNGMIQHHNGALVMVKELFDTAGAGQDAELFNFATDVDSGQRAEIKSMQTILAQLP